MAAPADWPRKTRELRNHHLDSTIWNQFRFRPDDVVIATYPKSGTTWMQQIVGQLVFRGAGVPINKISPWMDSRLNAAARLSALEARQHRRILKSHLPVDALVYAAEPKYIYVARDGRDVVWSLHHNHLNATERYYSAFNDTPGRVGPPIGPPDPDIRGYFRRWLRENGFPFWPYWEHVRGWWQARHLPNVLLVHFNDLKRDLDGEMRRVAAFLECAIPEEQWPQLRSHCTFEFMKSHADEVAPFGDAILEGGPGAFINKGENGRWRDVLTAGDISEYERTARIQLGQECARWLEGGSNALRESGR